MFFCKYKDTLGIPKKGLHSYRIFNVAIVDVISTVMAAYIIHKITKYNFAYCVLFLFILGVILHYIFCVKTTINIFIENIFNKIIQLNNSIFKLTTPTAT